MIWVGSTIKRGNYVEEIHEQRDHKIRERPFLNKILCLIGNIYTTKDKQKDIKNYIIISKKQ